MAKMFPPQPAGVISSTEHKAFQALERLPGNWQIYHSVPWRDRRQGEADFIAVAPQGALVFIEAKGPCEVINGRWAYRYTGRSTKDPWQQAKDVGDKVEKSLRAGKLPRRPSVHLAFFPDGEPAFAGGLDGQTERLLGSAEVRDVDLLARKLDAAIKAASRLQKTALRPYLPDELRIIDTVLIVEGAVKVPLAKDLRNVDDRLRELTEDQVDTYVMSMKCRRMLTLGGAGTGKTLLAAARAAQLAKQGVQVQVLTAHEYLAQMVRILLEKHGAQQDAVDVVSITQLATRLRAPEGTDDDFDARQWQKALTAGRWRPQALVVDDAHHLPVELVALLAGYDRESTESSLYLFADPWQTREKAWLEKLLASAGVELQATLRHNCRNTRQICAAASRALGREIHNFDVSGPAVEAMVVAEPMTGVREAQAAVRRLLNDNVDAREIAVLYDDPLWYAYLWPSAAEMLPSESLDVEDEVDPIEAAMLRERYEHLGYGGGSGGEPPDEDVALGDSDGEPYRRSTTITVRRRGGGEVSVRCLHLESVIGLEYQCVVLLLASEHFTQFYSADAPGRELTGRFDDDQGYDAGVWLRALSGKGALKTRAYVGATRARGHLAVIGDEKALRYFTTATHGISSAPS